MEEIEWHTAPLMDPPLVYALQVGLILTGFVFSIVAGIRLAIRYLGPTKSGKALAPFIALALLFTLVNLYMLNQPMGMRHGI
jgi:mannose/fructose/N-acetylgalactosamine-specific phosphotransferase system component IIC